MSNDAHLKNLLIYLDENTRKVMASFKPEGGRDAITPEEFMQAVNAAGFGGYEINQQQLKNATAKYNDGQPFDVVVGAVLDGKFSMRIDPTFMAAYLSCTLPLGGTAVEMNTILQEAENKGVTVPLDLKAIETALREGGKDILIASGTKPVHGMDGRFESLVPGMKKRSPHLDDHGLADFRDLGEIVTVHAGDPLMRRILPTSGEPGITVTGKAIPVKPGKNVTFSAKQSGAAIYPDDPDLLVAVISGCPVVSKDGVSVEPVYSIKNVDLHVGNISYDGTVHVTGDVMSDMSVKASGDIYVDGTVENALLEAGGDIVVKGGIIGGSELHEQFVPKLHVAIQCQGSCTARFVQHTHISAGNGIFIHDVAMLSELIAGQMIVVGDQGSRKGDIIGGITRATMLVKAKNLGSASNVKTEIFVGADKALHESQDLIKEKRETAEHKLASILKLLELAQLSPGRIQPEAVKAGEATRVSLNEEIEGCKEEEAELQKEIDITHGAQVIVEKHVFAGTDVSMGLQHCIMTVDKEGGVFGLNEEGKFIFT